MQKSSYYPKLYAVCLKMIRNYHDYETYDIYETIKECATLKEWRTDEYVICPESERAMNLHNRLKVSYEILNGIGKISGNKYSPKGYDIMPRIDADKISEEEIIEILNVFYKFSFCKVVDKTKDSINAQRKRLAKSLYSIDVEKSKELLNYAIERVNKGKIEDFEHLDSNGTIVKDGRDSYLILEQLYNLYRQTLILNIHFDFYGREITQITKKYHNTMVYCKRNLIEGADKIIKVLEKRYKQFEPFKKYYYTWLYLDLCCYAILQYVNSIIKSTSINICKYETLEKINSVLVESLEEEAIPVVQPSKNIDETMFKIYSYYYIRDKFLEDTKVLKYIMIECGERKNPEREYSVFNYLENKRSILQADYRQLFCEGEEVSRTTFEENYKDCYIAIDKINSKNGRNLSNNLITVKAIYREIYADKTLYNRRTSQHIFSEFLKNDKISVSDYYFLDEKINMGIFREYGYIEEYYKKNELQENLYALICMLLAKLDPNDILKAFHEVIKKINLVIDEIE